MTDGERVDAWLLAHLLDSVAAPRLVSASLTALAGALALAGIGSKPFVLAVLVIGLAALYLAIRVDFDARLFRALAQRDFQCEEMDHSLARIRLVSTHDPGPRDPRPWRSRCQGARSLFIAHLLAVAGQCLIAALALVA